MAGVETNIFAVENVEELSSQYRKYLIRGLRRDQSEVFSAMSKIGRKLSFSLKTPVVVLLEGGNAVAIVRNDAPALPDSIVLHSRKVHFERVGDVFALDYGLRTPENDIVCRRFLDSIIGASLRRIVSLWSPSAGQPLYQREPRSSFDGIGQYQGFNVRSVVTHDGGLGLCVDIGFKYVGLTSLPKHLTRDSFQQLPFSRYVYRCGHDWFEVKADSLCDQSAGEYEFRNGDRFVSLVEWVVGYSRKPVPPEVAALTEDTSVVYYRNPRNEERAAPSSLLYPTYGTDHPNAARMHRRSVLQPDYRHRETRKIAGSMLQRLRIGPSELKVATEPTKAPQRIFPVPDLEFGNGVVLSTRGTPGAREVAARRAGEARLGLLYEPNVGFHTKSPLKRQYLIVPGSVADAGGSVFVDELCKAVDALIGTPGSYQPIVVKYNDRGPRTYRGQGNPILDAARRACSHPGYAVVMIHHTANRRLREEDKLEAAIIRKLYTDCHVTATVVHSDKTLECVEMARDATPATYRIAPDKTGLYRSYLRNVAMSKVLIANSQWPYVLATRLHADTTIGVDIKNHMVGFVVVSRHGRKIRWTVQPSKQAEHPTRSEALSHLVALLREEVRFSDGHLPLNIVIQRDGRIFDPEVTGYEEALQQLKIEGAVDPNATLTIVEIPKGMPAPVRLYEVNGKGDGNRITNPDLGRYYVAGEDGYICSTSGIRNGTVHPLHVRYVRGALGFEHVLEDVFALTVLGSWWSPDRSTRDPLTTRLNDRLLSAEAAEVDEEELQLIEVISATAGV